MDDKLDLKLDNGSDKCCCKKKYRDDAEFKSLINRLSRIYGQVRGIKSMLESDAYFIDILTQVSAVSAAIGAFSKELLSNHIKTCVVRDIQEGREDTVDELLKTLQKLMK